jgi:hypothetical protein
MTYWERLKIAAYAEFFGNRSLKGAISVTMDYLFTLTFSIIYGAVFWLCNMPWFAIVLIVHFTTFRWFYDRDIEN